MQGMDFFMSIRPGSGVAVVAAEDPDDADTYRTVALFSRMSDAEAFYRSCVNGEIDPLEEDDE